MSNTSDLPSRYNDAFTEDPVENTQDLPEPEEATTIPSNAEVTTEDPSQPEPIAIDPLSQPLADNDIGVTAPPPPYWSISPANDIIQGPSIGHNESQSSQSLSTAPPPAYHTLFGDVETTQPEPQVEIDINDPEPSQDQAATNQHPAGDVGNNSQPAEAEKKDKGKIFLYCLVMGLALPISMIIMGEKSECPANRNVPNISTAGGILHILHGFTTYYRGQLGCRNNSCDPFILAIAIWSFAGIYNVFGFNTVDNCDAGLYYFILLITFLYTVAFGTAIIFFISVVIIPRIKERLERMN